MTVPEFIELTRAAEADPTRKLKDHNLDDLEILRRKVTKDGRVTELDELLVSWMGRPRNGYIVWWKLKTAPPKAKQQALF